MSEYDLVCDVCQRALAPREGAVCWTTERMREHDHRLAHAECVPPTATDRVELTLLTQPTGFLGFVADRFAREIEDPGELAAVVWALSPFVTRADTATEIQALRAMTFGATLGVKPTEIRRRRLPGRDREP